MSGIGTLVALTAYLGRLYGPLTALSNVQVDVMTTLVSFERVLEVLDLEPAIVDAEDPVPLPAGPTTVTVDAVTFRYPTAAEVSLASLEAELRAALAAAQMADVVAALPEGLETVVGDRGHRMSGGEKQRIAIARLLLADPGVVVLDEATAQLDSSSEAAVQEALAVALKGRTSIVIAHRLSTIRNADEIAVLDGGRVVERGTHESLMAAGGRYADLVRTQDGIAVAA